MTECQSATPEPSAESIRRSLRALAERSEQRRVPSDVTSAGHDVEEIVDHDVERSEAIAGHDAEGFGEVVDHDVEGFEEVVDDAEHVLPCARAAANFLRDGGFSALDDAVSTAERNGSKRVAQRGRRARSVLRDLDTALLGDA